MDGTTERELTDLQASWGTLYDIDWRAGEFWASHRQSGASVHRATAGELGLAIRLDHDSRSMIP